MSRLLSTALLLGLLWTVAATEPDRRRQAAEVADLRQEVARLQADDRARSLQLVDMQVFDASTGLSLDGVRVVIEDYAISLETSGAGLVRLALTGATGERVPASLRRRGYLDALCELTLGERQVQRVAMSRDPDFDPLAGIRDRTVRPGGVGSHVNRKADAHKGAGL